MLVKYHFSQPSPSIVHLISFEFPDRLYNGMHVNSIKHQIQNPFLYRSRGRLKINVCLRH